MLKDKETEKNVIKIEKENPVLNPFTLKLELAKVRRDRKDWEHIDYDTSEIQTLMPDLRGSTSTIDTGILNIETVRNNALLGYEDIEKLPEQLRYQRYQNIDIYGRIVRSKYEDWKESKKILDDDDYTMLVDDLNEDEQGLTFAELSKLSGKSAREILNILKRCDGFILLGNLMRSGYEEMVMFDDFYVRLIPVLNEDNTLSHLEYQYLLKTKAIKVFMEGLEKTIA